MEFFLLFSLWCNDEPKIITPGIVESFVTTHESEGYWLAAGPKGLPIRMQDPSERDVTFRFDDGSFIVNHENSARGYSKWTVGEKVVRKQSACDIKIEKQ